MYKRTTYKKATPINWKMWLFIGLGFILLFPLMRFVIRQYNKFKSLEVEIDKENSEIQSDLNFIQNQNPLTAQSNADKITTRKDVQSAAKQLAHHLGTKYSDKNYWWSWLDPRGWTENDKEVADILLYQRANYSYLKRLYNEIYTNNRSLTDDIITLLDESELKRVQKKLNLT